MRDVVPQLIPRGLANPNVPLPATTVDDVGQMLGRCSSVQDVIGIAYPAYFEVN